MLHLIFQNHCALVTTPLEMIKSSLTNMFGNSYFRDLLHFVYIDHVAMVCVCFISTSHVHPHHVF
jgi:hypothetical protein